MTWVFFLAAIAFVFVGLGGSLYSAGKAIEANRLSKTGVLTEATVVRVDVEEVRTRENDMDVFKKRYREVVAYQTPSGEAFETRLVAKSEGEPRLAPGDRVAIRYDAANPERAVEAHGSRAFRDAVAGAVFGMVFALAAAFLAMKTGKGLTAVHSGAVVWAAGALLAAVLLIALWCVRGTIALPDMKPFTGRLRVESGERTTITTFRDGKPLSERVYVRGRALKEQAPER